MKDRKSMTKYHKRLLTTIKTKSFPSCEVGFTFLRLIVNSTSKSSHWDEVSIILTFFSHLGDLLYRIFFWVSCFLSWSIGKYKKNEQEIKLESRLGWRILDSTSYKSIFPQIQKKSRFQKLQIHIYPNPRSANHYQDRCTTYWKSNVCFFVLVGMLKASLISILYNNIAKCDIRKK